LILGLPIYQLYSYKQVVAAKAQSRKTGCGVADSEGDSVH
jgi:hypothetical protein